MMFFLGIIYLEIQKIALNKMNFLVFANKQLLHLYEIKKAKNDKGNFKPLSILLNFSKIIAKLMYQQLYGHCGFILSPT